MRTIFFLISFIVIFNSNNVLAQQTAPVPKKSPLTPVKSQHIININKKMPSSRILSGKATIINTQTLSLNGFKIHIFGIVTPQLNASYGPQARLTLDKLVSSKTKCKVLDRQRDGYYLARCHNNLNQDFGLELLRRGLSVTARGSIKQTDIERNYIAAEQTAKNNKLGLWSINIPNAASNRNILNNATKMAKAKLKETIKETIKEKEIITPKEKPNISNIIKTKKDETNKLTADEILAALSQPPLEQITVTDQTIENINNTKSIAERFQLLIFGCLMLLSVLIITLFKSITSLLKDKEEKQSIAAAIRGELMAMRSICKARISKIEDNNSEEDIAWPKLRTLVFQAYVGRIGNLGAELSRKIASIYGQASDYAAYYRSCNSQSDIASKQKALELIVGYIDDVNFSLSQIETSGILINTKTKASIRFLKLEAKKIPKQRANENAITENKENTKKRNATKKTLRLFCKSNNEICSKKIIKKKENTRKSSAKKQQRKTKKVSSKINFSAPIFKKIESIKNKATNQLKHRKKHADEFDIPDYENLSEKEIEDLLYEEDETFAILDDAKKAG